MKHVQPRVYLIGKTEPDREGVRAWLDSIGADQFPIPESTPGNMLTTLAGKRCYMSYQPGLNPNVTRIKTDLSEFIDNILRTGHGSILEHVVYNFAIEGVSRVFTAELNRHRFTAISEESGRYIRYEDIPFWTPTSIQEQPDDPPAIKAAKAQTREVFCRAFRQMEENYRELVTIWNVAELQEFALKKRLTSLFRRIVGQGVATGGVWSFNLRALRHIFTVRISPHAEEEITLVASLIFDRMEEAEPDIFGDFHKVDGFWQPKYRV